MKKYITTYAVLKAKVGRRGKKLHLLLFGKKETLCGKNYNLLYEIKGEVDCKVCLKLKKWMEAPDYRPDWMNIKVNGDV